jgi:hypothetical protein
LTGGPTPWRYRALGRVLAAADHVLPARLLPGLDADALIAAAGVTPAAASREGLQRLLAALRADSDLTAFGRLSIRWDMIRLLRNAALIDAAHDANPSLAVAPIAAPIFILGLPRSGTTFLHSLLAEDPENQVPRNWQTIYPAPRRPGFDPAADPKARLVATQLQMFAGIAPGFAQAHPVGADSPQECSEITSHAFRSYRFDTIFRVPRYLDWLERAGDLDAFTFHRRFLQFLQAGQPAHWVLKCPDHTFSLTSILRVYPDARFVIVHRDPLQVLASNAHLTELLRRPFLRNVDPAEIGRLDAQRWVDGANRLLAFGSRADVPPARQFHIRHQELIGAPLDAIAAIYRQFDRPLSATALAAMRARLNAAPRGGYARHAPYTLDRFGISAEQLTASFAGYVDRYCRAEASAG